jgi:chromate transporter
MVTYIRKLAVERKGWLTAGEFSEGVAFCQMVPGATAMQTAAYVGLRLRGVAGAAVCLIGFGLPAFCLMLFFAATYAQTGSLPPVAAAFSGLQAVIVAVVANAAWSFGKTTIKKWQHFLIAGCAAALFWWKVNPMVVIALAAAAGWLLLPPPDAADFRAARSVAIPFYKNALIIILAVAGVVLVALYFLAGELYRLALLMIKVDLMAFGGGFASVPLMYHEVVEANGWLDGRTFMNGIVLGQVTPGPVVITATFIGYLLGGGLGALIASLCIFLPSFLMVIGLAPFFTRLTASPLFQKVIRGVLASFVGLLISVTLRFAFQVQWDVIHALLAAGALVALLLKVDILWVVLAGAALSIGLMR